MTYLAISIGAVIGANARFVIGEWVTQRLGSVFPFGTLLINVTGSFLLGIVLTALAERSGAPWWVRPALAIGFLGSYTTFSTFSYETLGLVQAGSFVLAALNIAGSVAATPFSMSSRRRNRPGSAGTSLSFSSAAQAGWQKSPVPTTPMPLRAAQWARCSRSRSRLVAREYFECTCRSA